MRYLLVLIFMACLPLPVGALKAQDKPNIVLILAFDLMLQKRITSKMSVKRISLGSAGLSQPSFF